eukprot:CAMPEP_0172383556 /NCGR_PEP_ID=MMETSP1061-20121228/1414_1 /TAXON_ID=37318 /ORGANISM="Pseudo-nitzschia pungens, Strain cf. pungens" /LENGTH=472 /DNA_ID=CAMNT_0013111841 /DNA_START=202 /DNA_END=1620 /DNA_ORIENTATION=+
MTKTSSQAQQIARRQPLGSERISSWSLAVVLVSCITIGYCTAFHVAHPYSNRALGRLHVTSMASSPPPSSSSSPSSSSIYDRNEFEMQVGRAMDTLRDDYPNILVKDPDYSIYSADMELIDPSGFHVHGVRNYENAIRLVHTLVSLFYCPEQSDLTFRMCFDKARQNIRIHWNAHVVPKAIFGGEKTTLHVDGISIYEFDRQTGNITQHRLERLVMNDDQITTEQGVFAALRKQALASQVDGIPSFHRHMESMTKITGDKLQTNLNQNLPDNVLRFQNFNSRGSLLFGDDDNNDNRDDNHDDRLSSFVTASSARSRLTAMSSSATSDPDGDSSAADDLKKKNAARQKFGLKPLTMEEFLEIEQQIKELDTQQQKKAAAAAVDLERTKQQKQNSGGFLGKLFGQVMKDTCESNYDCERPEVCCDFGFKKMCCSSGMRVVDGFQNRQGQLAEVPVPIYNPNPWPGNDPRNRDPW